MIRPNLVRSGLPVVAAVVLASTTSGFVVETKVAPFPNVPPPQAEDRVPLGDSRSFLEVKLNLPIAPGPFVSTWESIGNNHPGKPAWQHEDKAVTHKDSVKPSVRPSGGAVIQLSPSK